MEDAILDCSTRGGIVLDAFVGSGTTFIAAERAGRRGFGLEFEPRYVDVTLRASAIFTGIEPLHAESGFTLKEFEYDRTRSVGNPLTRRNTTMNGTPTNERETHEQYRRDVT